MTTNVWTKERIQSLLETNDRAIGRALLVLYRRQTYEEQKTYETRNDNGIGFASCDARAGTGMALFFSKNNYLTTKQIAYWRKKMKSGTSRIGKYWKQLQNEIMEKEQHEAGN